MARTPSWAGLTRLVRERPVTTTLVHASSFRAGRPADHALREFRGLYPHQALVVIAGGAEDPVGLFHLGRAGIPGLILLATDRLEAELPRAIAGSRQGSVPAVVTRAVGSQLPRRDLQAVRIALEGLHRRWSAEEFAAVVGLSRPFLSERLKERGLPSAGHLLIWVRLLHAARWLGEPGRTGESVSRQLEYSSGAAFRRAMKSYTGATPTEVVDRGGLDFVLRCFLDRCGLEEPRSRVRVSVA